MLRRTANSANPQYMPQFIDDWSQTTSITINTDDGSQAYIFYKMRDKWVFKVGGGLTMYNLVFDATDSII